MAGTPRKRYLIALVAALAVLALPGAAQASKVFIKDENLGPRAAERGGGTPVLQYRAGKGEDNRLRVAGDGFSVVVVDKGATIKAGEGCDRVNRHGARCDIPMTRQRLKSTILARAKLKGGGDKAKGTGMLCLLRDGGRGDDRVRGADSADRTNGGPGSDVVNGGANAPCNDDIAVYQNRSDDLRISLGGNSRNDGGQRDGKPGNRDKLVNVEGVVGGTGDDVLLGTGDDDILIPLLGEDV